jgi:mRNA-degrading endonuclease RelE of RelBE toxin-antitoxin system
VVINVTTLGSWEVELSDEAVRQFEKIVPKKFRRSTLTQVISRLSTEPDVEAGSIKQLSPEREPFFHGREVWQLKLDDYRFFYELIEGKVVIVFFVGSKGSGTTAEMVNQT